MNGVIKNIVFEVEKFNNSIKESLDAKNISNTGEAAKSLRVDYGEDFVRSIGIFYLEFLDKGRYKGNHPPFAPISKWVATKLGIVEEKQNKSVTFAIMNKIAELGTEIARNNSKGIEIDEKISKLRESLADAIQAGTVTEINRILDKYKKLWMLKKQI